MELWFFDLHVEKKKIFQSVKPWFLVFHIKKKKKTYFKILSSNITPLANENTKDIPIV